MCDFTAITDSSKYNDLTLRHFLHIVFLVHLPLYLVVHWFFSGSRCFCCSCVFSLGRFSLRPVALLPSEHSDMQCKYPDISEKINNHKVFKYHKHTVNVPWMMQLPYHRPLSMQYHPIYPNHHSGKKNNNRFWVYYSAVPTFTQKKSFHFLDKKLLKNAHIL